MVIQRTDYGGVPLYEQKERSKIHDYDVGEEADIKESKIYIDQRQHVENYTININLTGQNLPEIASGSELRKPTYIFEADVVDKLLTVLSDIEEFLDDAGAFEQKISSFLSIIDEFENRKGKREIYFSDLLLILKMALAKIECNELTESGISVLRETISCLAKEVTEQKLKELRGRLRECGIDLLKPFKSDLNVKNILKEIYPDEITT